MTNYKGEYMKTNNARRGFTLIELLVVVLIIGILAAVALPQYQKAVAKSRFASLKPIAKAVKDAQEIYYNQEGSYTTTPTALDIQIPADAQVEMVNEEGHAFVRVTQDLLNNAYTVYLDHSENFAGNIYCEAHKDHQQAIEICESEGGKNPEKDGDYWYYLLSGNSTGTFSAAPLLGDLDGDGQVTADDVDIIFDCISSANCDPTWDVNGDGGIDMADVQAISNLSNGLNWDGSLP